MWYFWYVNKTLWFNPGLEAVPPPAGPCPLAQSPSLPPLYLPPFLLSLFSAASCVQLLTLIPNRCCHFCLATASDYSTGACHKNPLSPFSPAQHMEQTADEMWYEGFQEHGFFIPPLLLLLLATRRSRPVVGCIRWQFFRCVRSDKDSIWSRRCGIAFCPVLLADHTFLCHVWTSICVLKCMNTTVRGFDVPWKLPSFKMWNTCSTWHISYWQFPYM